MAMGWSKGRSMVLSIPNRSLCSLKGFQLKLVEGVFRNCFLKVWSTPSRLVSFLWPPWAKLHSGLPWALQPYLCSNLPRGPEPDLSSSALHFPFATPVLSHIWQSCFCPQNCHQSNGSQIWVGRLSWGACKNLATKSHWCTVWGWGLGICI